MVSVYTSKVVESNTHRGCPLPTNRLPIEHEKAPPHLLVDSLLFSLFLCFLYWFAGLGSSSPGPLDSDPAFCWIRELVECRGREVERVHVAARAGIGDLDLDRLATALNVDVAATDGVAVGLASKCLEQALRDGHNKVRVVVRPATGTETGL